MPDDGWMSIAEVAEKLGVSEYRVRQALLALGLIDSGKKDRADARRIIYPPGTSEKVDKWLEEH